MTSSNPTPRAPVDLEALCNAAIAASSRARPPNPAFLEAVRRMRAGDGSGAAEALTALDDRARYLATSLLERLGVRFGVAPEAIHAVGLAVVRGMKPKAVKDLHCKGWLWDQGWRAEALGAVHAERLSDQRQGGYAAGELLAAVKRACAAGDFDTATKHAEAIDAYHKDARALALCALAAASSGKQRDARFLEAVKAAKAGPMIQDGGEESSALGKVVEQLAEHLPADHAAVEAAFKALLTLGKKRAAKDVRSPGLARAARAAAKAGSPAWIARATSLLGSIHSPELTWAPLLGIALAHRAAGDAKAEAEALARIPSRAYLDHDKVRALYPERAELLVKHWIASDSKFADIELIRAAGGDASARIKGAIAEKAKWYQGMEAAYASLVTIDAEIAARVLTNCKAPAVAHHMAAGSLEFDGRLDEARAHFVKALDLGLRDGNIAQHERILADRALRDRVEAMVIDEPKLDDRASALTDLAELWWRDGDIDRAIATIGHLTVSTAVEEKKVWEPWYQMGDRAGWKPYVAQPAIAPVPPPPTGTFETAQAALKKLSDRESVDGWWDLGERLSDPNELRVVRARIAQYKPAAMATFRAYRLVEIDLRLGDFDAALEAALEMHTGYYSERSAVFGARRIAEQLVAHPGALTRSRAIKVIEVFRASDPSLVGPALLTALPTLMVALPEADREALVAAAHKRLKDNAVSVRAAEAVGRAWSGDMARASALLAEAIALGGDELPGEELARAVALAERDQRLPNRRALLTGAMARCKGEPYQLGIAIEHTARYLWLADEVDLLPELLRTDLFPSDVRAQTRRSLIVEAPLHAPRPVDAVLAAWSTEPPNLDQALEQIASLAAALDREGRAAEAERVRATLSKR